MLHEKEMQHVGLLSVKTEKEEGRSEANDKLSCDHEEQNLRKAAMTPSSSQSQILFLQKSLWSLV